MDPALFAADLASKAEQLRALAASLQPNPWIDAFAATGYNPGARIVFVGMGSSHYAASMVAARMRAKGMICVAELASSDLLPAPKPGDLVVAVSAGGGSVETRAAVDFYAGTSPIVLLTNKPDSELASLADAVVDLRAGVEVGGVACRSFAHTLVLLLALEDAIVGLGRDLGNLVRSAAESVDDINEREAEWLPKLRSLIDGPDGLHVVAPNRRLSSALQSALMLREGPRLTAVGHETGDWSHVDVYLTKTTDYRLLLLAGSQWEPALLQWVAERGSTLLAIGADVPGAGASLRYLHDDDDDVRLLAETTYCELLACDLWLHG